MFGAIVGILFAFRYIPFIVISTWIAFGLGVLTLIFLVIGVFLGAVTGPNALAKCLCKNTTCLLVGVLGTIISALAALSIVLTPVFISVITLVAIGAFFFSLMILGLIALISCIASKLCCFHKED
ncbi:MAG: hypothetical protein Q8876_04945 [Bacillota bacterium]|nr:hypothetical protein [Bacillota bacterium]